MPLRCPNCGQEVPSEPIRCPRCGYRSERAPEYLWLYLVGGAVIVCGLTLGIVGVLIENAAPGHWSERLRGWFPLGPWPPAYHWLAFIVAGVALTVGGMGLTRHRFAAWTLLAALSAWEIAWTGRKLLTGGPGEPGPLWAGPLLVGEVLFAALLVRARLALQRTPARDIRRLQTGVVRGKEDGAEDDASERPA